MNWKDETWLLAVFDELIERCDEEVLARCFEENPVLIVILERIADENKL